VIMADAKKPAKGEKKGAEKSAVKKVADAVKSTAKAVAEVASHPIKALEHPVQTAKKVAKEVTSAVEGVATTPSATNGHAVDVRGNKRTLAGVIRSDKMDKTVVVEVVSLRRDPVYGKYLKDRTRYHAHDEKNEFHTGDRVEIQEHRPLSRHKRWIVSRLIERARVE